LIPEICYEKNDVLTVILRKLKRKTKFIFFSDIDFERRSGEITLFSLNILLVFITTYNYEQFFEVVKNPT
jgi:hypothetical protein